MIKALLIASAGVVALGFSGAAEAKSRVGVLRCGVEGGPAFVVGSSRDVACTFTGNGRRERYFGRINRYGLDVGTTGRSVLVWAVYAETDRLRGRALAGKYVGGSADVALGVGGGGNILVGGSGRTISLQPVSLKAETGVALGVGVGDLVLR
jgi:hypothetical protein